MTARRVTLGGLAAIALSLVAGRWGTSIYADYLWFASLGAADVWRAKEFATAALTVGSFLVATLFTFANLYAVRHSVVSLVLPRRIGNLEIGEEVPGKYLLATAAAMSVLMGAVLVLPDDMWTSLMLARIGRPFVERDPFLNANLGFFVYWLPFETDLHFWAVLLLVSVTVVVVMLYALTPSLRWERGRMYVSTYVRRHFMMLGATVLLILSWSYRLSMYRLLMVGSGSLGTFTAVDHKVLLTAMLILSVITLCAAFIVAWSGWTGQIRLAFGTVTVVLLLSLLSRTVAPLAFGRSADTAQRKNDEAAYFATHLAYTRVAYGVDTMRIHPDLRTAGFASDADAALRVALWDDDVILRASERIRRTRAQGLLAGWHASGDGLAASTVERTSDGSLDSRDAWSIARYDATAADERGLPARLAEGNPDREDIFIGEPAVYDSAPDYSVLSDSAHQLIGVEMVSTSSRLVHAWSLQNFRLLFGDLPPNRPALIERRDIRDRIDALVPFFVQGSEVVPVVANDSLYWVVELYSASATYPLSRRAVLLGAERSYFQHAATAVVHANSGRVQFISDPTPDPIAMSWMQRFPSMFKTQSALSASLAAALPPIADGARAQAWALGAAGFRGDSLDVRHLAPVDSETGAVRGATRAVIPGIPGVSSAWPLLDGNDRLRGIFVASGGVNRSNWWVPLNATPHRWSWISDHLRAADSTVHDAPTLRGLIRAIPIQGQAVFMEPTYLARPAAAPSLQHIATIHGDSVRGGITLATALGAISAPGAPPVSGTLINPVRADSLYRAMREALSKGDWAQFGRAFDALGTLLHARRP